MSPIATGLMVRICAICVENRRKRNCSFVGRLTEFGGASYFDLKWTRPRNVVGQVVDILSARLCARIDKAEAGVMSGDAAQAVATLKSLDGLPPGSYQRQLFLEAAMETRDWQGIVDTTDPPTTIEELVRRFDALCRLRDFEGTLDSLDRFSKLLRLPESQEAELCKRASVQQAIGR